MEFTNGFKCNYERVANTQIEETNRMKRVLFITMTWPKAIHPGEDKKIRSLLREVMLQIL